MKVLVLNCSPKGDNSDCLKVTKAFLRGLNEEAEIINVDELKINSCKGCFSCWHQTPGKCILNDDMPALLDKIVSSDLVIWSAPLYCFGLPACGKAVIDRLLPLTCQTQEKAEDGSTYHPSREKVTTAFMLISGCGFPNIEHNYEALLLQFSMMFHEFSRILCVEAPLLSIPEAEPVVTPYLQLVELAGKEYKANRKISEETQKALDAPMLPPDEYRKEASNA